MSILNGMALINYDGKLIPVDPSRWGADPLVAGKLKQFRSMYPEILVTVGKTAARMYRCYIEESDVGKVSDVITQYFENREVVAVPKRGRQIDKTPR
jgi:hypothetical protein